MTIYRLNGQRVTREEFLASSKGISAGSSFTLIDREKVIGDGVKSILDGKAYTNRGSYEQHLKDRGCFVVGNDLNKATEKKRELRGDFNVRNELGRAVHEVLNRN